MDAPERRLKRIPGEPNERRSRDPERMSIAPLAPARGLVPQLVPPAVPLPLRSMRSARISSNVGSWTMTLR